MVPSPDPTAPITQTADGKWFTKIQLDWVPLPAAIIAQLGWDESTELEAFVMYNNQIVIRKRGALDATGAVGT